MKKINKVLLATYVTLTSLMAQAEYSFPTYINSKQSIEADLLPVNFITISPLCGKAEMKQGNVKEKGWLYGLRGNFHTISPNKIYLGAEMGYKFGDLIGKADASFVSVNIVNPENKEEMPNVIMVKNETKSRYSDLWLEGRVGFTLSNEYLPHSFISPFFVIGAEREKDTFVSTGSLDVKHQIEYGYLGCGAISSFFIRPDLSLGANLKFKWMFNSLAKTSRSNQVKDKDISSASHLHCSLEVPLIWNLSDNTAISASPFYEYKKYKRHKLVEAGKEDSKLHMYGASIKLDYAF